MEEMYVWKVGLQIQWKSEWTENKKKCSDYWEDENREFIVAAVSGYDAIKKAEKLALQQEPWPGEHYCDDDTTILTREAPYKVLDIISLELLQTLDG